MRTVLETERLRLRELVPDDLDFLADLMGDEDVMRFYPNTLDRAAAELWLQRQIRRYQRDGHGFWLVEDEASGEPLGQVGLLSQTVGPVVHPEIAYLIHLPHQRKGYATEAASAVRDYAFGTLWKPYVTSFIRPDNIPSQRVAWKVGLRPAGMITWADMDHVLFRLDREGPAPRR